MRLIDLIEKHDDDSILMRMAMLYDTAGDREEYRRVLGVLRTIRPASGSGMKLYVKLIANEEDGWYDAGGHDGSTHRGGSPVDYDLEYLPWDEWLGMAIEDSTLASMQEVEIIVHSLWNMTMVSFDPDDIQWEDGTHCKDGVWSVPLDDIDDDMLEDLLDEFDGSA